MGRVSTVFREYDKPNASNGNVQTTCISKRRNFFIFTYVDYWRIEQSIGIGFTRRSYKRILIFVLNFSSIPGCYENISQLMVFSLDVPPSHSLRDMHHSRGNGKDKKD